MGVSSMEEAWLIFACLVYAGKLPGFTGRSASHPVLQKIFKTTSPA